jgi:hypothetical protein
MVFSVPKLPFLHENKGTIGALVFVDCLFAHSWITSATSPSLPILTTASPRLLTG